MQQINVNFPYDSAINYLAPSIPTPTFAIHNPQPIKRTSHPTIFFSHPGFFKNTLIIFIPFLSYFPPYFLLLSFAWFIKMFADSILPTCQGLSSYHHFYEIFTLLLQNFNTGKKRFDQETYHR